MYILISSNALKAHYAPNGFFGNTKKSVTHKKDNDQTNELNRHISKPLLSMFDISCCGLSVESGNVYTVYDKVINNVNTFYNLFSKEFSQEIIMSLLDSISIAMTHFKLSFISL